MLRLPDSARQRFRPSPNVAPTSSLPVLSSKPPSLSIELMRWGISTGSPTLPLLINARSETAPALARFGRMLSSPRGRGVVAADGYYEWEAQSKQPYFVRRSDGEPMLLAVLVAREEEGGRRGSGGGGGGGRGDDDGEEEGEGGEGRQRPPSFVILTRAPPKALRWLHDRCPCILPSEELAREWLGAPGTSGATAARDPATSATEASELLLRAGAAVEASFAQGEKSTCSPLLSWHPVTKEVGKTSYQRGDASKDVRLGGIASLFGKAKKAETNKEEGERSASAAAAAGAAATKEIPSPLLPRPPSPGEKRKEEWEYVDASNEKHLQLRPAKKARPTAAKTTTKAPGKGQRSLDFFLSPKKEEDNKET